jgi:hypothetical protein
VTKKATGRGEGEKAQHQEHRTPMVAEGQRSSGGIDRSSFRSQPRAVSSAIPGDGTAAIQPSQPRPRLVERTDKSKRSERWISAAADTLGTPRTKPGRVALLAGPVLLLDNGPGENVSATPRLVALISGECVDDGSDNIA